ncbi:Protein of unknown function [Priestia filamentosa]|nr:Protein of unknown function [Priestia filamentosa]
MNVEIVIFSLILNLIKACFTSVNKINHLFSLHKQQSLRKEPVIKENNGDDSMVKEIILNNTLIKVHSFEERKVNNSTEISVGFEVTSEAYHDIATLLCQGTFDVKVPERALSFIGTIKQYSTSITNLYEKGQVGDYSLTLLEVKN